MRYVKLPKDKIYDFLEHLKSFGILYGPQKISKQFYDLKKLEDVHTVELDYNRTITPPRQFFHAKKEVMFEFDTEQDHVLCDVCGEDDTEIKMTGEENFVLFGLHACDIIGLRIMDSRFIDEFPDPYYMKRRERGIIVGISCTPDEYCFCNVRRADTADAGYDLFLHEIPDAFIIRVFSVTGHEIVDQNPKLFKKVTAEDTELVIEYEQKRKEQFTIQSGNWDDMRYALELKRNDPLWKRESEKCLACGNCTLTCPTCRCYDVKDIPSLDGKTGQRIRFWDSCQYRSHGLVAGNHNFRPTKEDRFKNRYMCKNAYCEELTLAYCVGCGRCTAFCPAEINYKENLMEIKNIITYEERKSTAPKQTEEVTQHG